MITQQLQFRVVLFPSNNFKVFSLKNFVESSKNLIIKTNTNKE